MIVRKTFFQLCNEIVQRYPEPFADHFQLYDVNSAFATLDLADRWLFEGKFLAQLNLRDSGPMTNLDQQLEEDGIVPRMNALSHHDGGG